MKTRRLPIALAALAAVCVLGACDDNEDESQDRYDAVKDDVTPNLDTLYQRPVDIDNAVIVTFDENARMFTQDLGRAFYWDRPSRLTREPVPQP